MLVQINISNIQRTVHFWTQLWVQNHKMSEWHNGETTDVLNMWRKLWESFENVNTFVVMSLRLLVGLAFHWLNEKQVQECCLWDQETHRSNHLVSFLSMEMQIWCHSRGQSYLCSTTFYFLFPKCGNKPKF